MMKNLFIRIKNNKKAFSILEIMAATTVITLGLTSLITLTIQSIKIQNSNKNELIASQLAQEGVELIRNARDMNWYLDKSWSDNLNNGSYVIDYTKTNNPVSVTGLNDINTKLFVNGSGFYNHTTGTSTIFRRMVSIAKNTAFTTITSTVRYAEGTNTKNYSVSSILYDWK